MGTGASRIMDKSYIFVLRILDNIRIFRTIMIDCIHDIPFNWHEKHLTTSINAFAKKKYDKNLMKQIKK